jgi:4a-hydroxytetrahydrobiopterin dehydratase
MPAPTLTDAELAEALATLPEWRVQDGKLHREYRFADFVHAFGFMAASAMEIEKLNHHPEWFNVWNRVVVDLTTHDSGGITAKDVKLAGILDQFAAKLS